MPLANLNYVAVVVAALAAFVLGAIWYSPLLFGKAWVAASGHSEEKLAQMEKTTAVRFAITLVAFLIMAGVIAEIAAIFGLVRVQGGVKLGLMLWVGFGLTLELIHTMYNARRWSAFLIDTGYTLVYLVVMGAIIAAWR